MAVLEKFRSLTKPKVKPKANPQGVAIDDPVKFLLDNGLLFESNRTLFHLVGLALVAAPPVEKGGSMRLVVVDYGDEPIVFDEETFGHGRSKWRAFYRLKGILRFNTRRQKLGIAAQTMADYKEQKRLAS